MTNELKKIVNELGDTAWVAGQLFEKWVEPRVNALLQAIDELEALREELAQKSWRVIGQNFENRPELGEYVMVYTEGKVLDVPANAGWIDRDGDEFWLVWERLIGTPYEFCTPIKPGDAWMPWPTEGPKLLEVNND